MGVRYNKGRWEARCQIGGEPYHIGSFDTKEDAQEAYDWTTEHPYSLLKEPPYAMTHQEIAEELGITRQAVDRLEKSAMSKLRKSWVMRMLAEEYL